MKNIEKSLENFLKGTAPRVSYEELIEYANKSSKDADEIIDILFRVINYELDLYDGSKSLDKIRDLLQSISAVLLNSDNINRGIVGRKAGGLNYKLEHLRESNKNIIVDYDMAIKEIEKTRLAAFALSEQTELRNTKQYDVIDYLVNEIKENIYVEKAFEVDTSLVNAKDRQETSLFENIIIKYMNSVIHGNEKDTLYYSNLLTLIMNQSNFNLLEKDKRRCLEIIHREMDHMSYNKKNKKKNAAQLDFLNNLVDSIMGETKEVKIEELAKKYNISIYFDPNIICQIDSIKTKTGTMTDREIVDDYTITIDDDDAIEIDDALTCRKLSNGNYLLGVHIASILGYFPYESDVVQEAISRGRSIYLPKKYQSKEDDYNRVIPIFHYKFSAEKASLRPGESKLARSYFFEIDKNGNIVNEEFKKTIIKSDLQATYSQIDDVIMNGSSNKELDRIVNCLFEVTNILDRKYNVSDIYENVKDSVDDFSELLVKNIGSQRIINKIMMLTGNRVASFFKEHNYPCLYRVHRVDEAITIKLQAMIDNWRRTYGDQLEREQYRRLFSQLSGLYPKGKYDIDGSHFGMGLEHYCHCTSGLRRAPDIVVEHCLEVCYDRVPTDEDIINLQHEINYVVNRINSKQDMIDWFVRDYKSVYQKRR